MILYATDIHGDRDFYERLLEEAEKLRVSYVVIGGDITPLEFLISDMGCEGQRQFLEEELIPRIHHFHNQTGIEVYIIMGNDDYNINADLLEKADEQGILHFIHQKICPIGKRFIAGYSFINPTPFLFKEWERSEDQLKTDLDCLCKNHEPRQLILACHAPPFDTHLDIIHNGQHVGSTGIRKFIEEKQPFLTLHGHIHESPDLSGSCSDTIGKTRAFNPGNKRMMLIDLDHPEQVLMMG